MNLLHAGILGIVEGVTEFLPISSTAHLVFASRLLGLEQTAFLGTFEIAIQLGAILAVSLVVARRFLVDPRLIPVTLAGFVPTMIAGAVAYPFVKGLLNGTPLIPILALGIGGVLLIVFERVQSGSLRIGTRLEAVSYRQAAFVGLAQCVAFVPGVSRAAATVVGGMWAGLDRRAAVELSFMLAIPTMAAATGLDLLKSGFSFSSSEWLLLGTGAATSFLTATVSVRWLLRYIQTHTFAGFGLYRIVAAFVLAFVLL